MVTSIQKTPPEKTPPGALSTALWVLRCVGARHAGPLPEEDAPALAARLEERRLRPGETLLTGGRTPDGVWVVRSGEVELTVGSGRRRAVLGVLRPSGIAGDVPLLIGDPVAYTARTLTDVQAVFLPAAPFLGLLERHPNLSRLWLTGLARRFAQGETTLLCTIAGTATERTARLLLRESRGGVVTCSQATLAAMIGIQRPTLNRVLKELESQGLIRLRYRQVAVVSPEGLRRRSAGGAG